MSLDPRNVLHRRVLFENHRFEVVLLFDQSKPLQNKGTIEAEAACIIVDALQRVDLFKRLIGQNDVIGRTRIYQDLSIAIEYGAARGRDRYQAYTLILGFLAVIGAFNNLQVIETDAEN